jgi:hypothetical protein
MTRKRVARAIARVNGMRNKGQVLKRHNRSFYFLFHLFLLHLLHLLRFLLLRSLRAAFHPLAIAERMYKRKNVKRTTDVDDLGLTRNRSAFCSLIFIYYVLESLVFYRIYK